MLTVGRGLLLMALKRACNYGSTSPNIKLKSDVEPSSCVNLVKHDKLNWPSVVFSGLMTIAMLDFPVNEALPNMEVAFNFDITDHKIVKLSVQYLRPRATMDSSIRLYVSPVLNLDAMVGRKHLALGSKLRFSLKNYQ